MKITFSTPQIMGGGTFVIVSLGHNIGGRVPAVP